PGVWRIWSNTRVPTASGVGTVTASETTHVAVTSHAGGSLRTGIPLDVLTRARPKACKVRRACWLTRIVCCGAFSLRKFDCGGQRPKSGIRHHPVKRRFRLHIQRLGLTILKRPFQVHQRIVRVTESRVADRQTEIVWILLLREKRLCNSPIA